MKSFDIGAVCNIGLKKATNQDRILALVGETKGEEFGVFVVSDGIGGMDFGELASELTINTVKKWWETRITLIMRQQDEQLLEKVDEELEKLLHKLNKQIFEHGRRYGRSGGTTLSLIFIYGQDFLVKHTGDSRIYMLDSSLIRLTKDQSWIEREVDCGRLSEEQARMHPKRNMLTMCLGVFEEVKIQSLRGCVPMNAVFMLCSDGLYGYFNNDELEKNMLDLKMKVSTSAQELANDLLAKIITEGAHDNISLIIISTMTKSILERFKNLIRYVR